MKNASIAIVLTLAAPVAFAQSNQSGGAGGTTSPTGQPGDSRVTPAKQADTPPVLGEGGNKNDETSRMRTQQQTGSKPVRGTVR